ncbi:PR5-like receptor kinase [Pistacia vera]|uniref:PR5-like receptor kinase n=1 Tax=Pistacia vera TaxID=55513 RepID=UPI001262BB70|nr:PR5-like receptor kinase [Pistacia vera]
MTNSFRDKLGEGGYGGVYKGKLLDGRNVAVKVLKEAKGNGEEFINEVASISRTSHVNIVALLGFCFEGSKRALVYEFMPNGSLEKFIYEKSMETNQKLTWENLYQIAVGIAQGLEYLRRGCSTRILHFDIKPHNILLDEEFCPKISDFGLAKICLKKESIISLTGTRGTIGYIVPEVVSRNFGEVSHKSDVYSYSNARYDGKIDFNSWKKKMKALLSHNKVGIALEKDEEKWPADKLKRKAEIDEESYNLIVMNLANNVLRKVDGLEAPIALWGKLETLYALQTAQILLS